MAVGSRFALRAGQVFDGLAFRGPGEVVVDSGVVVAVGRAAGDVPVVDLGTDATLLPGLVDPHVHLVFDATDDAVPDIQQVPDGELMVQVRERARAMLAAGITTARDLGDRRYLTLPLRRELLDRPDAGPELLCAGPPLTTPRGHCWFLGGEVEPEAAALRAAVAERAERGVDVVKVMVTGGELTPGSDGGIVQFDRAALDVVVAEARLHGLPVAAHAHAPAGIASSLAAGVDSIEHCSFMTADGVHPDDDLRQAVAASGVVVSLTLGFAPTDRPMPQRLRERLPALLAGVRRMIEAGATVTVGSDAGISPVKPHDVLPYGATGLARLCGDTEVAMRAATSVASRACGVAARKGTLSPGYDADILAVHGNLAEDVEALHAVTAVYRAGHQVAGPRPAHQPTPAA